MAANTIEFILRLTARAFLEGLSQSQRGFDDTLKNMALASASQAQKIDQSLANIGSFRQLKLQLNETQTQWQEATRTVKDLASQMRQTEEPTKKLAKEFDQAKKAAAALKFTFEQQRAALQRQRDGLREAGISTTQLVDGQRRLKQELQAATHEAQAHAQALKSFSTIGTRPIRDIRVEISQLKTAYRELAQSGKVSATDLVRANQQVQQRLRDLRGEMRGLAGEARGLGSGLASIQGAFATLGVGLMGKSVMDASFGLDRVRIALRAVTGSTEGAAKEFEFVTSESDRLGLSLDAMSEGYVQMTAATKGTVLEGEKTRDVFRAVTEASAVLGLSADNTGGVINALSQMVSKGTVSAEELRGQMGERMPGAFQAAAHAMGMTTEALGEALEKGEIAASTFLPLFAAEVRKTYSVGLPDAINTSLSHLTRLDNYWMLTKDHFAKAGFMDGMTAAFKALSAAINDPANQRGLASLSAGIGSLIKLTVDHATAIASLVAGYVAYRTATLLVTAAQSALATVQLLLAGSFGAATLAMAPLVIALGAAALAALYFTRSSKEADIAAAGMADAIGGLKKAFDPQAAAAQQAKTEQLAVALGQAGEKTRSLQTALDEVPQTTTADVHANTLSAMDNLAAVQKSLDAIQDKTVTVTVKQSFVEQHAGGGWAGVHPFARGGQLAGYGGGDTVPALLEPGEFIVRKERANLFAGLLTAVNQGSSSQVLQAMASVPRFQSGGVVPGFAIPQVPQTPNPPPRETNVLELRSQNQAPARLEVLSSRMELNRFIGLLKEAGRGMVA